MCTEERLGLLLLTLITDLPYPPGTDRFSSRRVSVNVADRHYEDIYAHYADAEGWLAIDIAEHVDPTVREIIGAIAKQKGSMVITYPGGSAEFTAGGARKSITPLLAHCK